MAYLSTATHTRLVAQLARIEAQIAAADAAMLKLVAGEIESFSLNTGEGTQSSKRWDAGNILTLISRLEQYAESIRQRLNGKGIVNMNVRRKEGM